MHKQVKNTFYSVSCLIMGSRMRGLIFACLATVLSFEMKYLYLSIYLPIYKCVHLATCCSYRNMNQWTFPVFLWHAWGFMAAPGKAELKPAGISHFPLLPHTLLFHSFSYWRQELVFCSLGLRKHWLHCVWFENVIGCECDVKNEEMSWAFPNKACVFK